MQHINKITHRESSYLDRRGAGLQFQNNTGNWRSLLSERGFSRGSDDVGFRGLRGLSKLNSGII